MKLINKLASFLSAKQDFIVDLIPSLSSLK